MRMGTQQLQPVYSELSVYCTHMVLSPVLSNTNYFIFSVQGQFDS